MALPRGIYVVGFCSPRAQSPLLSPSPNPITQLESQALPRSVQLQSGVLAAPGLHYAAGERWSAAALGASPETAPAGPSPRGSPSPCVDPSSSPRQPHQPPVSMVELSRAFPFSKGGPLLLLPASLRCWAGTPPAEVLPRRSKNNDL